MVLEVLVLYLHTSFHQGNRGSTAVMRIDIKLRAKHRRLCLIGHDNERTAVMHHIKIGLTL